MTKPFTRPGVALLAASLTLVLAPSADAATAVFGGTTSDDEPIVVRSDTKAKTLRSLVVSWEAKCGDGMYLPVANELTAIRLRPGDTPDPRDLMVSRNGKGRFAGTQLVAFVMGDQTAAVQVDIAGRLRSRRATGTLTATSTIFDATGAKVDTCETGRVNWSATRAPGRVYGGKTGQEQPVVVRLNRQRKRVVDLIYGWESAGCQPPGFVRFSERLTNFRISRRGAFGATFDTSFGGGNEPKATLTYSVDGRVARKASAGTLRVQLEQADPSGTVTQTCDSGTVRWRATSG